MSGYYFQDFPYRRAFAWSLIMTEFLNHIILAKNKELKDGELARGVRKVNIAY